MGFRFHLLGLAHIPTSLDHPQCAYTGKILRLAIMLKKLGHTVYFYGVEGSQVECDEFIPVLSEAFRKNVYGDYDTKKEFFKHDGNDSAHFEFNRKAVIEIKKRMLPTDFLLITMGNYQKPIADAVGLMKTVESGIGYSGVFAGFRVFESYGWMQYMYGALGQKDGSWYDAVIPNYYDPAEFPMGKHDGDYYLFVGRLILRKGLDVAVQVTRELGKKLIVAGQGKLVNPAEYINITDPHVEHIGSVDVVERAKLMGSAIACFAPTYYIEPFGGVAVESQLCGTPVLTTDWGVFPETIEHGTTGYRCRTMDDFIFGATHAKNLDYEYIRQRAIANWSMDRVVKMYQEYFTKVDDIQTGSGWYQKHPERTQLDWLEKF